MPWNTLELDRNTATTKDVKRAYAKRLKLCRPDQDPEGFRKLHDAYSQALEDLEWREAHTQSAANTPVISDPLPFPSNGPTLESAPPAQAASPLPGGFPLYQPTLPEAETSSQSPPSIPQAAASPVAPSPALQAITQALDRLEAALKANEAEAEISTHVRYAESALFENPTEVARWGALMADLIRRYPTHSALRLKPEAVLFELEHEGNAAAIAVIQRMERQGRSGGISGLANYLLEHKARLTTGAGAIAIARLACGTSVWDKSLANRLADFAYEHLDRRARDLYMNIIDQHRKAGDALQEVPDRWKFFWINRLLLEPQHQQPWDDEESKEALQHLASPRGRVWECYPMLKRLVPKELAANMPGAPLHLGSSTLTHRLPASPSAEPEWDRSQPQSQIPPRRSGRPPAPHGQRRAIYTTPSQSNNIPIWPIIWGVIILVRVLAALTN